MEQQNRQYLKCSLKNFLQMVKISGKGSINLTNLGYKTGYGIHQIFVNRVSGETVFSE